MSHRRKESESDSGECEDKPANSCKDEEMTSDKKKTNIWATDLEDRHLEETFQKPAIEAEDDNTIERGPESFSIEKSLDKGSSYFDEAAEKRKLYFEKLKNFIPAAKRKTQAVEESLKSDTEDINLDEAESFGVPTVERSNLRKRKAINQELEYQQKVKKPNSNYKWTNKNQKKTVTRDESGHKIEHIELDVNTTSELLADQLAEILKEPNRELLKKCTDHLGNEICIQLLRKVESIENSGGMKTIDQHRRRTPGGIFFYLVRQPESCTASSETLEAIFGESDQQFKEKSKQRKKMFKAKRKEHLQNSSKQMEIDGEETVHDRQKVSEEAHTIGTDFNAE